MELRWSGVCIECSDAGELAEFYSALLEWPISARSGDWMQLSDPAGGVGLNIQEDPAYEPPAWPARPGEPAMMLHLEIEVDDVAAAVTHAEACGARQAPWQPPDRDAARLRVMLDPAGHPFCLYDDA